MPDEYDAFGRKTDDAGLGDLGWGTTTETQSTPQAAPREFQTVTPAKPGGLSKPRRSYGILFIQIAVIGAIIGAIVLAISAGKQANDTVRDTLNQFNVQTDPGGGGGGGTTVDDGDDTVPEQVKAASFFTPKGLRAGIKILAAEQPGKITNFSMRKDRINVQINRGGKSHNVQLSAGAEAPEEFGASAATQSSIKTMSYEELTFTAPERLMKAANARLGTSAKGVDYFVASKAFGPGTVEWGVYYKNGKIAYGDSRGRFTRRVS